MSLSKLCAVILAAVALGVGTHSSGAAQAAPAAPPAAPQPAPQPAPAVQPAAPQPPAPPAYPPQQQPYPPQQQAYPPQYPQQYQGYPQQAYPPQAYPQQYQGYPYPSTVYVTQPAKPQAPRPRRTMMIAGISVLLASYGVSLITGAALVDSDCCEDVGWALLIPVAGPYIAAGEADQGSGLLVLLGTVQVVGVGLTIGGAIQYALTKNAASRALSLKLPHGRDLSFDVSTSPRMAGPSMRLRF